ncbi:MAG TPA: polysaccharide biosynthesis/export family protein [Terracidiphilus sp.]|nr:polysaccharide biosynthesis/export family protein [Terracidiphilus sp.]
MKNFLTIAMLVGLCFSAIGEVQEPRLHPRDRYRLHTGDTILLEYRLSPELNQTVMVGPDGYVDLNVAGAVKLEGLTLAEAHDRIVQMDSARLNDPELNIELKDFQKPYVVVAGQVVNPSRIEMREDMTALQAVMLAGGFRDSAKESRIVLYRRLNSKTDMAEVHVLNLHRIQKTAQLEHDMALQAGDVLYVPENNVTQFGKIMRIPNFSMSSGVPLY